MDVAGQRAVLAAEQLGDDGAEVRIAFGGVLAAAGVHDVGALAVIVLRGVDAADEGEAVHLLGGVRQQFADVDAGHGGRDGLERPAGVGAGLGVPGFELADAAREEDDEDALVLPANLVGVGRREHVLEAEHADARRRRFPPGIGGAKRRVPANCKRNVSSWIPPREKHGVPVCKDVEHADNHRHQCPAKRIGINE